MQKNRRTTERHPICYVAWVDLADGALPRYCTLSDVSTGGARLQHYGQEIPDEFTLWLSGNGWLQRYCRAAWRTSEEIGVQFAPPLRPEDVGWMFRVVPPVNRQAAKAEAAANAPVTPPRESR